MTDIIAIAVLTVILAGLAGLLEWNDRRTGRGLPSWHTTDSDPRESDADTRRLWSELESGRR